jgi:ferrous iron transport protein A
MPDSKQISLSQMEAGQSGKVVQIQGGYGFANRLNSLGVRIGRKITKVSSMFMRGPVTIQAGNTQIAVGFGMAKRIIVELDENIADGQS